MREMNILSAKFYILIIFVLFLPSVYSQQFSVSGYITDKNNGETLINASVLDKNSSNGKVSNVYGFYSLRLQNGEVNLQYSYVGYLQKNIRFNLTKDTVINIQLESNTTLQEVTIVGNRNEIGVKGSQMSTIEVPITQIKTIPSLFGETDVLKALQLLPGVQAGSEGSAGLYVRGGGPDENLLIFDGVPVYNVNHAMGLFSVFNPDAVKNVTLYKGSFPARFGERLSSVVDIRMKDGDDKNYHGTVSVGLISSKANVEGPIIKEKTTFNVSFRRTYADLLMQPIIKIIAKQNDVESASAGYYFYDFNTKITHKINDKNKLFLSVYSGDDGIYFGNKYKYNYDSNSETVDDKLDWKWGNFISALRWNSVLNGKLFMNVTSAYTQYRFNMKLNEKLTSKTNTTESSSEMQLGYKTGINDYSTRLDFDYAPSPKHDLKFGLSHTYHTFRPGVVASQLIEKDGESTQKMDTTFGDSNIFAHEMVAYTEDNFTIIDALKINLGTHFSSFFVQGKSYFSVEPRLSARYLISDRFSTKIGYATMSQYIHLLSNNNISLPTDLWVPVTKQIEPMKSHQFSAGLFYEIPKLAEFSIEGYYKSMYNLIEYKDGASFLGQSTGWEEKVCMGDGTAYGVELLAQRSYGNTTGWIGYTWSKTNRLFNRAGQELNNGKVFPAKYDRRHSISLTLNHKFNEKIDISGSWVFNTGNTGTLALQYYQSAENPSQGMSKILYETPHVSSRNNYRYNPYHRMDIGVNFHKKKKHGTRTWNISVYNAYNNNNPFIVMTGTTPDGVDSHGNTKYKNVLKQYSVFPILPSVSYIYKF